MTKVYTDNNSLIIKNSNSNSYTASNVTMLEEKCIAINKKPNVPYYC